VRAAEARETRQSTRERLGGQLSRDLAVADLAPEPVLDRQGMTAVEDLEGPRIAASSEQRGDVVVVSHL